MVIVGCGARGLNRGLNMRDSGLDVAYALRKEAIDEARFGARRPKTASRSAPTKT